MYLWLMIFPLTFQLSLPLKSPMSLNNGEQSMAWSNIGQNASQDVNYQELFVYQKQIYVMFPVDDKKRK